MKSKKAAVLAAILAAAFYAISSPMSKLLLLKVTDKMMAAFLYLGAGMGMLLMGTVKKLTGKLDYEEKLTKKELPYTIGMILLDMLAPVFLMMGLRYSTAANVSLLNNFEIVVTSLIAATLFHEKILRQLWAAIGLITLSSLLLSIDSGAKIQISMGSIYVIIACITWGLENNCTRKMSSKSPAQIVTLKGIFSGFGILASAFLSGEHFPEVIYMILALALGFISYGLSIYFYVYAQRDLGASRTSTFYAAAPFIGTFFSMIIFRSIPGILFWIALFVMGAGTYLSAKECV